MKKILISLTLVVVLLLCVVTANASQNDPTDVAQWIGSELKSILSDDELNIDSADNLLNANNAENSSRIVGTIAGEGIEAKDLEVRATLYELAKSQNPLQEAWDSMKIQVYEKQLAAEYGITPTKEEIIEFTKEQRALIESTPEGKNYAKTLIEAAGMTEDEYWNDYKVKKESPAHLTSVKLAEYLEKNNLPELDKETILKTVDGEITDKAILNKF